MKKHLLKSLIVMTILLLVSAVFALLALIFKSLNENIFIYIFISISVLTIVNLFCIGHIAIKHYSKNQEERINKLKILK